jgi:hypothetical protein
MIHLKYNHKDVLDLDGTGTVIMTTYDTRYLDKYIAISITDLKPLKSYDIDITVRMEFLTGQPSPIKNRDDLYHVVGKPRVSKDGKVKVYRCVQEKRNGYCTSKDEEVVVTVNENDETITIDNLQYTL